MTIRKLTNKKHNHIHVLGQNQNIEDIKNIDLGDLDILDQGQDQDLEVKEKVEDIEVIGINIDPTDINLHGRKD